MAYIKEQLLDNYSAWKVEKDAYSGDLRDLIRWAVLAPSTHNTQPWIFDVEDESITVLPDPQRHLESSDPTGRQMFISLGASVANLRLSASVFGLDCVSRFIELDGKFSKRLIFSKKDGGPNKGEKELFDAIPKRVSNRSPHKDQKLPQAIKDFILATKEVPGLDISLIEDMGRKTKIAELVAKGDAEILGEGPFTTELSAWVKPNSTRHPDGMPGFGWNMPDYQSTMFSAFARSGKMAEVAPDGDFKLLSQQTTAIGVISTEGDNPENWMKAGEEFQKIALKAASLGLSINILAVLVEIGDYNKDLKNIVQVKGRPQVMFRLGYPTQEVLHAPRRQYQDTILSGPEGLKDVVQPHKPRILTLIPGEYELGQLQKEFEVKEVTDNYLCDLGELFIMKNPQLDFRKTPAQEALMDYVNGRNNQFDGNWVYYPWNRRLEHILSEEEFYQLLFSRNNPCISAEEQRAVRGLRVAIAGLSVGRCIAREAAALGITYFDLSDPDVVSRSNTPRMGAIAGSEIGENKAISTAHQLYEFNPYLDIKIRPEGVSKENLLEILFTNDIFIDHMENLSLKLSSRELARRVGKIVLMATDTGMAPIFDVETPDNPLFFGGRVANLKMLMEKPKELKDWIRMAAEVMGVENLPVQLMRNFIDVANSKQNYPSQLGMTGSVVAGKIAYYLYEIARKNTYYLSSFEVINIQSPDLVDQDEYRRTRKEFKDIFGL